MYYANYGDVDFFENGTYVANDPDCNTAYYIIRCLPYSDQEGHYMYGDLYVDISDSWIDRSAVMDYAGMDEESFDPVLFAIACTDYYSWENFGAEEGFPNFGWQDVTREEILDVLPEDVCLEC